MIVDTADYTTLFDACMHDGALQVGRAFIDRHISNIPTTSHYSNGVWLFGWNSTIITAVKCDQL